MSEEVLLTLGNYQFGMSTAAHESLARTKAYRWVTQYRLGREPASQYVGPGQQTISLKGTIYPHFRGGLGQIDNMKTEADVGEPLTLVDGLGYNLGRWVIKKITDTESNYVGEGLPRRVDFSLDLEAYGEDLNSGGGTSTGGGDSDSGGGLFNWLSLFA